MIKFNIETVLLLQNLIIEFSGGTSGVRDLKLLDSAIQSAFQTFGGVELYPTLEEKGARLGFNLVSNHSFVDGNKRIGILIMLTFFMVNGINFNFIDDDIITMGLNLANGTMDYESLLEFIKQKKI